MPKFKVAVSKNKKKYKIILNSENEKQAIKRIHSDGYSISGIEEISGTEIAGDRFYFEARKDGELKKGMLLGKDIFKIYLKLRRDIGYEVKVLYPVKNDLDDFGKVKIIKELETQYNIYLKTNKFEDRKKVDRNGKKKKSFDNFYMKKDMEETYNLIEFILSKLENIIKSGDYNLSFEEKEKLNHIHNDIIKLKNSTNISKIKEIGELALFRIGKIELENIKNNKEECSKGLLEETNKLLKKIGSKKQFVETGDNNIKHIILDFLNKINSFFSTLNFKKIVEKKEHIDKNSYAYLKTFVLLLKYENRLNQNNLLVFNNLFFIFFPFGKNRELRDDMFIKRRVIKQNINLLKAKISGRPYSYVGVIKGYKNLTESLIRFFSYIKNFIFLLVFSYSIIFLGFLMSSSYKLLDISFNYQGLFYLIIIIFVYFVLNLSRGILSLAFNFSMLFFVTIFGIINF